MAFTNYTIVPSDSLVVIDGTLYQLVDMGGIPATVHAIQWYGDQGTGTIEYNLNPLTGELPAPGTFTDPADYYNQTEACENPLTVYATSNDVIYHGSTFSVGSELVIYQYPHPPAPAEFTTIVPPDKTLYYTSAFWTGSAFVWSLFDPNGTLSAGKNTCASWVNSQAYNILQPSDWYVTRQNETGTPIPPEWNAWRELIRQEANAKNAGIAACDSNDELLTYTTEPAFGNWTPSP